MLNDFNEITRNEALRALTASSVDHHGVPSVRGHLGDLPVWWRLSAAHTMVRAGAGVDAIFWDPDGPGLVALDATGRPLFRFATVDPFGLPAPGPAPDPSVPARAALRVVRPAS